VVKFRSRRKTREGGDAMLKWILQPPPLPDSMVKETIVRLMPGIKAAVQCDLFATVLSLLKAE